MEAIVLGFTDKNVKVRNVDSENVSYLKTNLKGLSEGDVLSIKIESSNFFQGFLFISGAVEKVNDTDYYFDECIKCGGGYNEPSKPLCIRCWRGLQGENTMHKELPQKERTFKKDSSLKKESNIYKDFRKKYPANYRARDGHWVRSKSEKIIDDILYRNRILHEYEKKIPGEKMLTDFYLPEYKVWIEFWGIDTSEYNIKREAKVDLYKTHGYHDRLIELTEIEMGSIDDVLEQKLLEFGVKIDLE